MDQLTEQVYGHRWCVRRLQEDPRNRDRIRIYVSEKGIVCEWRTDVRDLLPEWVLTPQTGIQELIETAPEKLLLEVRDAIELSKNLIRAQMRIDELLAELRRANSENQGLGYSVLWR